MEGPTPRPTRPPLQLYVSTPRLWGFCLFPLSQQTVQESGYEGGDKSVQAAQRCWAQVS